MTSWLPAALSLAARGWHVFPCAIDAKRPALRGNWQDLATTDPAPIRRWWNDAPYNIGVSCGPSGLIVIDLDTPKTPVRPGGPSHGRTGTHSLTDLCAAHGQPFPHTTFTVATPSGGVHLYFRATSQPVRNTAGRLGPLIDTRADGGYVVGPGSRVNGREYIVVCPADPAPLPDWLADALSAEPDGPRPTAARPLPVPGTRAATAYAMAALRDETRRVATAMDGTRHDTLNKAAFSLGQLVAAGLLPDLAVITSLADAAQQAGLPERDIHRIIRSALAAGARKPRASLRAPAILRARPFHGPDHPVRPWLAAIPAPLGCHSIVHVPPAPDRLSQHLANRLAMVPSPSCRRGSAGAPPAPSPQPHHQARLPLSLRPRSGVQGPSPCSSRGTGASTPEPFVAYPGHRGHHPGQVPA
jgi:hypothetical protein